ncbi:hypothetical protein BDV93DRAFT_251037 [Ceratobasidium sp. AG-I]|nr:hypothetical protein BDV93DRAFT_251037 [Ceratobasidium sp. AG-I]
MQKEGAGMMDAARARIAEQSGNELPVTPSQQAPSQEPGIQPTLIQELNTRQLASQQPTLQDPVPQLSVSQQATPYEAVNRRPSSQLVTRSQRAPAHRSSRWFDKFNHFIFAVLICLSSRSTVYIGW